MIADRPLDMGFLARQLHGTLSPMQVHAITIPDGEVELVNRFLDPMTADRLQESIMAGTSWRQDPIRMFGRTIPQPRLVAWHGDPGAVYTYSRLRHEPEPWTHPLLEIRKRLVDAVGTFNSVLLNVYRDGRDHMGWHSDDEPELGEYPVIASVSLGATRRFVLKHRTRRDLRPVAIALESGSLLVMRGGTQNHWRHMVPATARPVGPRLNLTFRTIITPGTGK